MAATNCFVIAIVSMLTLCLLCVKSLHADDQEKKISRLVQAVVDDQHQMMIMSGGIEIGDIDQLLKMPHHFESAVQTVAHHAENQQILSSAMKTLIDAAASEESDDSKQLFVDATNNACADIDPTSIGAAHLANVLGHIGDRKSVPALIDLFQRAVDAKPDPGAADPMAFMKSYNRGTVAKHCTWALWNLTGRKKVGKPEDWQKWWESVEPYFETVANRMKERPLPDDFGRVLNRVQSKPKLGIAQLIAIGRSTVPELLKRLPDVDEKTAFSYCRVIDELNLASELPAKQRHSYFVKRLSTEFDAGMPGAMKDTWRRALIHSTFAEFSRISIDAERALVDQGGAPKLWSYTKLNLNDFNQKYGTSPYANRTYNNPRGLPTDSTANEGEVAAQVREAVPVLVKALSDENVSVRQCATQLAGTIGMVTNENPKELIVALRDAMFSDESENAGGMYGTALDRFESPIVTEAFRKGLFSDRESIVRASANNVDKRRFPLAENEKVYDRIEELVEHENSSMRFACVRTLRSAQPKRLIAHFDKLREDSSRHVLSELCRAINSLENPMHQGILVDIAINHENEYLRHDALTALGDPVFATAMDDLAPLLDDEKMAGFALSTIVQAKGSDALPILFQLIEEGRDRGNFVLQYLPRLTGKKFQTKDEWLEWWKQQSTSK